MAMITFKGEEMSAAALRAAMKIKNVIGARMYPGEGVLKHSDWSQRIDQMLSAGFIAKMIDAEFEKERSE